LKIVLWYNCAMQSRRRNKGNFRIFISIIAIVAIGFAFYFYIQLRTLKQNPQVVAQNETEMLVGKVGRLMVLPEGETPTIATVSDPAALKDQPFFALAQRGDKVLVYTSSKRAILYSVSLDKILNVAPLNTTDQNTVAPPDTLK